MPYKFKHVRRCPECGGDMSHSPILEDFDGKYIIWHCEYCDNTIREPVQEVKE